MYHTNLNNYQVQANYVSVGSYNLGNLVSEIGYNTR